MKGKLWEMALDELLVKMFYWGGRVVKGRVSQLPRLPSGVSGGLVLGGTWPSLKETHLH